MTKTLQRSAFALLAILSVNFVPSVSHANILLEPYLGYHLGTEKATGWNYNDNGISYGARFGFEQLGFMAGVDYMTGSWNDNANPSSNLTPSDLGIFVGYSFPMMVRVYGVYNFNSSLKESSSAINDTFKGTGVKLGLGFTALPLVSINLEYRASTYTKNNAGSLGSNLQNNMYGLTVSIPFTF